MRSLQVTLLTLPGNVKLGIVYKLAFYSSVFSENYEENTMSKNVPSDLEIAQAANLIHIDKIAEQMGLDPDLIPEHHENISPRFTLRFSTNSKIVLMPNTSMYGHHPDATG
jgi:hypothetical protein